MTDSNIWNLCSDIEKSFDSKNDGEKNIDKNVKKNEKNLNVRIVLLKNL